MNNQFDNSGKRLKSLIDNNQYVLTPGVFSPLIAMMAEKKGFKSMYFSGAAFSAMKGIPDIGIFTFQELFDAVIEITKMSNLPLIVDVDTGFGEVINVTRTVSDLESIGVAAIQIEDQLFPKRCGHLEGKEIIKAKEFAKKIYAAKSVSKDMLVIARTDAKAVEGIDSAIERAKLYKDAGADIIFPEALETEEEFKLFAESVNGDMLANMTEFGKTPYYPAEKFADMGYKIIIYPVSSLRIALNAISDLFDEIMKTGTQVKFVEDMLTRKDLYNLINYDSYVKMDESLGGDDLISK
jgi:methylisocitrate lyase|tara:strand:- start:1179 stop:2066 length:888 start_codon:yes stop_codon:yes gene_type:complete